MKRRMKPFMWLVIPVVLLLSRERLVGSDLNIAYGNDPKQRLSVYTASNSKASTHPVLIWVHGGGWLIGDKRNLAHVKLCRTWSATNMVVVNLNYRLTPDVVHPAHVEDVASGIAWVHENIAKYGGDKRRVFLLGHSAGAHLVALVATNPKYLKPHGLTPRDSLAGVMPIDTASFDLNATRGLAVRKMIDAAFGDDRNTLAEASPLTQARFHQDALPPFVIAVVKQRPEALSESKALHKAIPGSKLIVVDYPNSRQLRAHGRIAFDLLDLDNSMTRQLVTFVRGSAP